MRVIAGQYKGRNLRTVPGLDVRPTSDRLRETLFNILMMRIQDARFLDICAGSGAIGIEALSRGAQKVTMIEATKQATKIIKDNLTTCKIDHGVEVITEDAITALKYFSKKEAQFDIVYLDPPYKSEIYLPIMELLGNSELIADQGIIIVEHHTKLKFPESFGVLYSYRELKQGETQLTFFERRELNRNEQDKQD